MLKKYLCRVVSNSFQIISNVMVLGDEIEKLKSNNESGLVLLDAIYNFHNMILLKKGRIDVIRILNNFYSFTGLKVNDSNRNEIIKSFGRERVIDLMLLLANLSIKDSRYILLMEMLVNTLAYKNDGLFYIFRISFFDYDHYERVIIEKIYSNIKETSFNYLREKKVFTLDDIKRNVLSLKEKLESKIKINEIYLFGSYAKGTNDKYSDVDLLFKLENNNNSKLIQKLIKNEFKEKYDMETDIVIMSLPPDEFDKSMMDSGIRIF